MSATAEASPMRVIGHPQPRIEGWLKVTGAAHYAADHHLPGMLYAVPLGATIARAEIMRWPRGAHASTFGGNPLACAVGLAVLREIDALDLVAHTAELGRYFTARLNELLAAK